MPSAWMLQQKEEVSRFLATVSYVIINCGREYFTPQVHNLCEYILCQASVTISTAVQRLVHTSEKTTKKKQLRMCIAIFITMSSPIGIGIYIF